MSNGSSILLDLNEHVPDVYPDKSIHSIEIEAAMPIWDKRGEDDFATMIKKGINIVFVCFVNRSGSNYLLDLIQQLDLGAKPTDEAFNYDQVIARCRKNNIGSFSQYLAKILIANSQGGICFLKIGGEQLFWLTKHGLLSRMMNEGVSPKFLLTSRGDKVAQAVSLFIAEATGRFSESKEEGGRTPNRDVSVDYDAAKILDRLRYVDYQEHLFSLFFAVHELSCLPVQYEALLADPKAVLRKILHYVGASEASLARVDAIETKGKILVRQGGALNRRLVQQFRHDFRIGNHADETITEAAHA